MINAVLTLAAALLDAAIGDPPRAPHAVRLMGRAIAWLEPVLRAVFGQGPSLIWAGLVMIILVAGGAWLAASGLLALAGALWAPLYWLVWLLLAFQSLAAGQLYREAARVLAALETGDLPLARRRLSMIVGRETANLDQTQVRRAVIETVAENFNDGVVAPLFFLALGGPALALTYKAVNTMDSMVGYENFRYFFLGRLPARLDDVAGYIPARISALLLSAGALLTGSNGNGAWQKALAEHSHHKSPNAGWPEAAAAGALDLRLGGPNHYHGVLVEKPWLNPDGRDPAPGDAAACLRMFAAACVLASALAALAGLI